MDVDPQEKPTGIDRKRIYTAAAALVVAGAAGHFMQKTAGGSESPAMLTAAAPPVAAPEILAALPETAADATVAAAPAPLPESLPGEMAPLPVEDNLAAVDIAVPETETVSEEAPSEISLADIVPDDPGVEMVDEPAPEIVAVAPVVTRPKPKPGIIPDIGVPSTAIYPAPKAGLMLEEVTRAATDPLLTITEAKPEHAQDTVFAAASDPVELPPTVRAAPVEPVVDGCAIDLQSTAKPGAMMEISVSAPCNSGEAVSFEHAGLKFGEQLGPDGSLILDVPAMTGTARVVLRFGDGAEREIELTLPDFDEYDRIAVNWKGATGLQLHALEGGADYAEKGHIWADTPGTTEAAITGTGGFLSVLGSAAGGYAADIYTYPAGLMRQGVEPEVSIEAEVMNNTCGTTIEGAILRTNATGDPNAEPLTMVVPACDAVGDFLVLRDLPVELKLARR